MDNSNRQIDHLGVNKMGKNIKKSPLHQPNFPTAAAANASRQQPQPQVYNINKNDFRNIVQQLTGSPSRDPPPRPPQNHPKPPNHRLQRVRPPPLARPQMPMRPLLPNPVPQQAQPMVPPPYPNNYPRHPPPHPPLHPHSHYDQPPPTYMPPTPNDIWANTTESPVSAYMQYLQNSIIDTGPPHSQARPQMPGQPHLLPNPVGQPQFPPRMNGPPQNLPSPRMNGPPPPLLSPRVNGPPPSLPSPRMTGQPPLLPSPNAQYLLPSPTGQYLLPSPGSFFGVPSPRSPFPLLSPGYPHPPPMSPNFSFSSVGQSGILGPGPHPPPSPGYGFPSPGFFHIPSPRWRDQYQ